MRSQMEFGNEGQNRRQRVVEFGNEAKSYTAKQITELLESRRAETLLHQLRIAKSHHKTHSDIRSRKKAAILS